MLELIPCTEYLSPESQKSHFWKLKIGHHNCAGIKYISSKYYLQILEEFHQKLNELQQLEDELENNVRKWHWAGHVQKTITHHSKLPTPCPLLCWGITSIAHNYLSNIHSFIYLPTHCHTDILVTIHIWYTTIPRVSSSYRRLRCAYLYYTHLLPLLTSYIVNCSR